MDSTGKKLSDIFDDDFEVTYEDDPGVTLDMYGDNTQRIDSRRSRLKEPIYDNSYEYGEEYDEEEEGEDTYDGGGEGGRGRSGLRRRKSRSGVPLAAPIQKGGKALSRISSALLRQLSAILIIATMAYVTYNFWRASAPYGDIMESVQGGALSQTLAAYLSVPSLFLLFELIALLWAMTRVRVRSGRETWKEDTGRGFLSFIIVFVSSYTAFLFGRFLPDSPEIIYGIKGALEVYGSLHNALLGLCAAGAISCLIRRYQSY